MDQGWPRKLAYSPVMSVNVISLWAAIRTDQLLVEMLLTLLARLLPSRWLLNESLLKRRNVREYPPERAHPATASFLFSPTPTNNGRGGVFAWKQSLFLTQASWMTDPVAMETSRRGRRRKRRMTGSVCCCSQCQLWETEETLLLFLSRSYRN